MNNFGEFLDQSIDINVLSDQFKSKIKNKGIMVVGFISNNQPFLACSITEDLTSKYDAVSIIKEGAQLIDGGGGGRKSFAKAGGKNKKNIQAAIIQMKKMVIG